MSWEKSPAKSVLIERRAQRLQDNSEGRKAWIYAFSLEGKAVSYDIGSSNAGANRASESRERQSEELAAGTFPSVCTAPHRAASRIHSTKCPRRAAGICI